MITTILAIIALLAANAFFVAAEFALVKVRGSRIEYLVDQGSSKAKLTLRILRNIEAYLAACQLGITMASLGLGWLGEPFVAALLEPLFHSLGFSDAFLHSVSFLLGFLIFSSLHIVVGEQVPKTMAIRQAELVSLWTAYPLQLFYLLCYPLNWALNRASRWILQWLGIAEGSHVEVYSQEELKGVIDASHRHGAMQKQQFNMLDGILELDEVEVADIMTHRKSVETLDAGASIDEAITQLAKSPYTRMPIHEGDSDAIVGVVHTKDALAMSIRNPDERKSLLEIASPPWFIPETTSLRRQLLEFRQRREHLAIVVDEYGDIQGIVTLEDILEEIVGEIDDEKDVFVDGIKRGSDGTIVADGNVTVRDLNRQMDWDLPDEDASTIAGLVIHTAGKIPEIGEAFNFETWRFEVVERVGHQVTTVKIGRTKLDDHDA